MVVGVKGGDGVIAGDGEAMIREGWAVKGLWGSAGW